MKGIWLPIITPFKEDNLDLVSYKKLIDYYIEQGISGIIPMGTTGESPSLLDSEKERLLEATLEYVNHRVPVYFGHGGNATKKVVHGLKVLENSGIEGILSVSPYYNRPSQEGILEHFKQISNSTDLDILLYNIPYRTGRNMTNETLRQLAKEKNIIGVKDACGDFNQSIDLLMNRPENFSIMSGEDTTLFSSLTLGGDGAVSASAHLHTTKFMAMYEAIINKDLIKAQKIWNDLYPIIPYLFKEPNPAPIKYLLKALKLIETQEMRLPMTNCSKEFEETLNTLIPALSYSGQ